MECPDPLAESFVNVSPYNHSNNNPINFTDPTGLAPVFQNGGWDEYNGVPDWVKNGLTAYDRDIRNGFEYNQYENRKYGWESYNGKIGGFNASLKSVGVNHVFLPIVEVSGFSNFSSFLKNVENIATLAYTAYENGAKFDTYTNPSSGHLYGKNPYGAYMGPENANEAEVFGDLLGLTQIPIAAQLGDAISLIANIYKGSGSGIAMSAVAFFPFGSQLKLATKTVGSGAQYSVAFEMKLASNLYPGGSYRAHFQAANTSLSNAMASDAVFANSMSKLGISIPRSSSGSILGKSPTNWGWHHDINAGVMQLVPKAQHPSIPSGIFWNTMHPGGKGGMSIWNK